MKCYFCAGVQIFLDRILTTYPSNQCGLKKGSPSGVTRTPGQDKTCNWARRRSRCPGITHGTVNGFAPATLDCDLFRAPNTNLLIYLFHFHFSRFVCFIFVWICLRTWTLSGYTCSEFLFGYFTKEQQFVKDKNNKQTVILVNTCCQCPYLSIKVFHTPEPFLDCFHSW